MAEREPDRAHPELLRDEAVRAFVAEANREIGPEFRRLLREHDAVPGFFDGADLAAAARTGLEAEIAQSIDPDENSRSLDALCDVLRRRGERYAWE